MSRETKLTIWLGLTFLSTCLPTMAIAGSPVDAPHETQLTHDGFLKRDPVFWPGGKELFYTVEAKTGQMRIVRMNLETGEVSQFDERPDLSDREMSVSADGQVYAFNVVTGLSSKIHVVDNVRERRVTMPKMGKKTWSNWPSVSPDGTRVLFTEGAAVIYSFDLLTANGQKNVTRLSPAGSTSASDYWPRFSPDGETVVFTSNRDDDFEIYAMHHDGSLQRRLTNCPGIDMHPSYSPDGQHIAFTSNRDGNYEIYVMNANGDEATRVTNNPERDDHVCWTLAGDAIVYVSERKGRFDLIRRSLLLK